MPARKRLLLAVCLTLAAGALRFHKLGAWPFGGDELTTIAEAASLFDRQAVSEPSQVTRLPRAIPLSHAIHYADYQLFGTSEFGSRVVPALLGCLSVGLAFWFLDRTLGTTTALATALLVLVWPEHVLQSQWNRFYIIVAFFSFLTLLVGSAYVQTRRPVFLFSAFGLSLLTVLTHTLTATVLGVLCAAIVAAAIRDRRPLPTTFFVVALVSGLSVLCFYWWYLRPILAGWNQDETWGYGTIHSALASINIVGWPAALTACLGFLLMIRSGGGLEYYWMVAGSAFVAATLALPTLVVYHPEYVFPLALPALVLAGYAIAVVFDKLRTTSWPAAAAWFIVLPLCQLPSLVSHFADGSRADLRTAAAYVQSHWLAGSRVTGFSMGTFNYYAPECLPSIPLSPTRTTEQLSRLTRHGNAGPLWVVVQSGRSGLDRELQGWLDAGCERRLDVRRPRFDYFDFRAEVYLCGTRTVEQPADGAARSQERQR